MRISLNWLRDYLDLKPEVDIATISNSLTLAGLEVEAVHEVRHFSDKISLGVLIDVEPDNDKCLYKLEHKGETILAHGHKSAIPSGMLVGFVKDKPLHGNDAYRVATYGDLGFSSQAADVITLPMDASASDVPGKLSLVKEFDDVIFTLGITPNRADALSHLGVSRELSAILDVSARMPMLTPKEMAGPTHEKVGIEIDNAEDCPRYACRIAEGIQVSESPFWLKARLLSVGIRPINNVVDVTNYVMIARGQPMHAFDYDKLNKDAGRPKIIVRRANQDESIVSLDGQNIKLSSDDVVIADAGAPLAIAGVIGGLDSAVTEATTTVLLESAYFDPKNVRLTSRRHNISTESSYRFERCTDPNGVVDALNYAARLLTEISSAKICREPIDAYRKRIDALEIKMRPERAQTILGIDAEDFDQDILRRKFSKLGIETVAKRGDAIYFRVPTHRSDITREIDLIEEAARMIGYDKVRETSHGVHREATMFCDLRFNKVVRFISDGLAARGFSEVINYAFLNKDWQNKFVSDASSVIELKNPLSDRYAVLRLSLIPGLVRNLLHNQRNQEKSVQLFEMGTVFLGTRENGLKPSPELLSGPLNQDSFAHEKQMLAGVMAGRHSHYAFDQPERSFDFYDAKGSISEILHGLGFQTQYPQRNIVFSHGAQSDFLHPGESATIEHIVGDERYGIGRVGKLHPSIAAELELFAEVYLFEIDLDEVARFAQRDVTFKPFSRFPMIERDVAFLVNDDVLVGDLLSAAADVAHAKETLSAIRVFDIYRGKNIDAGKKSVAIAMALKHDDRTLTDEEAEAFVKEYTDLVEQRTGGKLR